jgi:hypothetical protein
MATRALITDAELDEWRRVYPTGGAAAVQALFPHRSRNCINVTAHRHGIKVSDLTAFQLANCEAMRSRCKHRGAGRWTRESDDILRHDYLELGPRGVMPMLPGRTYGAIVSRAGVISANSPHAPVFQRDHNLQSRGASVEQAA